MRTEKRFLRREAKVEIESTEGWMVRITRANHYAGVNTLMRYLRHTLKNPNITLNQINRGEQLGALQHLSDLAQVPLESLINGTFRRYAPILTPHFIAEMREEDLTQANDLAYRLFRTEVHACSSCVSTNPILELSWYLDFKLLCLEHLQFLSNVCYGCGGVLSAEELVRNKCSNCECAFSNTPIVVVKASSYIFQSQALLCSLFQANPLIALEVPTTDVSVLLWLFLGIKDAVLHAGIEWGFHYKEELLLDDKTSNMKATLTEGELLATAYKALLNWPDGFHSFLDAYRNRPNKAEGHGISREFGILYTTWLKNRWILPQFQFVHDAFNDYVAKYLPPYERLRRNDWAKSYPEIRNDSDFISIENAAKEYGYSLMQILRWLNSGHLVKYPASDGIIEYLKRSELEIVIK